MVHFKYFYDTSIQKGGIKRVINVNVNMLLQRLFLPMQNNGLNYGFCV